MKWVSRIADQKDEAARRVDNLRAGANTLFAELLRRTAHALEIYNIRIQRPNDERAYLEIQTVRLGTPNPAGGGYVSTLGSDNIVLTLQAPSTITATYSSGQAAEVFNIHENDKQYLHLEHKNEIVAIDRATEIILGRFLFGDLADG
jgi:hypothetical protein